MLPTFVIGLREGLEAALIVGIIAAFLRKQGRVDLVRWVFVGVGSAIGLCVAVGVTLDLVSRSLPQRQQEGLETVIGVLAVGMVTYMVVWMRRHSRELKGQLEGVTAGALAAGTGRAARAMIVMAFLAVLREGFETVVFLLAAFNESGSGASAGVGAVLGIAVATALGFGIYRGGVRLNLSKFFRATGVVLVLVAAGLVVNALHTAHEAGWLSAGQSSTLDLSWLVRPGSVQASLLTGMLGIQPHPVLIEVVGWLVYLVPVGCYVVWPPGRGLRPAVLVRVLGATAATFAVAAVVAGLARPDAPEERPVTAAGGLTAQLASDAGPESVVRTQLPSGTGLLADVAVHRADAETRAGLATDVYVATLPGATPDAPPTLSRAELARLNDGRLPIGLPVGAGAIGVHYRATEALTVWVEPRSGRIIDIRWVESVRATVDGRGAGIELARPVSQTTRSLPDAAVRDASAASRAAAERMDTRAALLSLTWTAASLAGLAVLAGAAAAAAAARGAAAGRPATQPNAIGAALASNTD